MCFKWRWLHWSKFKRSFSQKSALNKKRNKLTSILVNLAKRNIYLNVQKIPNDYENGLCIFTVNKKMDKFLFIFMCCNFDCFFFLLFFTISFPTLNTTFYSTSYVLITYSFIYSLLYHGYFDLSYNYQFFTLSVPLSVTFHYSFFHN